MTSWLQTLADKAALHGAAVRISIARAQGSVPREAGAFMIVTEGGTEGTIGGGALELDAVSKARSILSDEKLAARAPWQRETKDYPLGPTLGQCCGGYVKVLFELYRRAEAAALLTLDCSKETACLAVRPIESGVPIRILTHRRDGYTSLPLHVIRVTRDMFSAARPLGAVFLPASKRSQPWFVEPVDRAKTPLFLYGAGHVGRAIMGVLNGLPFEVTWIDTSAGRFPAGIVERAELTILVARDPAAIAKTAPRGAFHLVMTYSHPLDFAICHEVLKSGTFTYLGLIGSVTKRARFMKRLRELGHNESNLNRLTCPIGIPNVTGKAPATIAISVAAQLLERAASASCNAKISREESGVAP
jgi:xanthine dehydrogenase accessory factor